MNAFEIADTMVRRWGYDRLVRDGDNHFQVEGFSTDMAFVKDPRLPLNRFAFVDGDKGTIHITSETNPEIDVVLTEDAFWEMDRDVFNEPVGRRSRRN